MIQVDTIIKQNLEELEVLVLMILSFKLNIFLKGKQKKYETRMWWFILL